MKADSIIETVKKQTNNIMLFHSGTGKDSICLLEMLSKLFKIQPVFQYTVKNLDYELNYINWAEKKYNVKFYQTPHFILRSFIKSGYLGIKQDKTISKTTIAKLDEKLRIKFGLNWSCYGFKKNDGLTRRLMLNGYKNGVCESTNKFYPLMDYSNKEVLNYISDNNLIPPFCYDKKKPSSGCDISNPIFLNYIRNKYPNDLKKIFETFPCCEVILFKYDKYGK
jgi:sulfate adenylyltransferase subunit 2